VAGGIDMEPRTVEASYDKAARNQCDRRKAEFYTTNFMTWADQTTDA